MLDQHHPRAKSVGHGGPVSQAPEWRPDVLQRIPDPSIRSVLSTKAAQSQVFSRYSSFSSSSLCGIGFVLLGWVVTVHADLEQPWTAIPRYLCVVCTSYGSVSPMVDIEKLGTPLLPTPLDSSDPTATDMMLPFLL